MKKPFLLTVDYEITGYANPLSATAFVEITQLLLEWLKQSRCQCTFFCVGEVLEKYPDLIHKIAQAGHEIACHGWRHIPLDRLTPNELEHDLNQFLEYSRMLGLDSIKGYRAPFFSLTQKTAWALEIIQRNGFTYDSSILPANTLLYGYPSSPQYPHRLANGLIEIPITVWQPLSRLGLKTGIPLLGGTYLRLLPASLVLQLASRDEDSRQPLVGFFHPYDIDPEPADINAFANNPLYNALLKVGRKKMRGKLTMLLQNRPSQTLDAWIISNASALP